VVSYYESVVISSQDYSPFGVTLSGRSWSEGYRYGFNGKEKDNETFSGAYDFGARIMDVRLGRWLSVDPKSFTLCSQSTYQCERNFTYNPAFCGKFGNLLCPKK